MQDNQNQRAEIELKCTAYWLHTHSHDNYLFPWYLGSVRSIKNTCEIIGYGVSVVR